MVLTVVKFEPHTRRDLLTAREVIVGARFDFVTKIRADPNVAVEYTAEIGSNTASVCHRLPTAVSGCLPLTSTRHSPLLPTDRSPQVLDATAVAARCSRWDDEA